MGRNKKLEEALYFTALHIPDLEEREVFLRHTCKDSPEMREAIEGLLAAEETADDLVSKGLAAIANSTESLGGPNTDTQAEDFVDERIGTRLGPYLLVESLGKGGYGEVYLAEQTEPVRRQVAVKVIKLGMDTKSVIQRFSAERRALALMEHPNIARVLDAGATLLGRPYFVMELVRGVRITDYCRSHHTSLRDRVRLVIQICEAIQHAHQKGIIHRDIKPSNVLVSERDGYPFPKIIDFGIAKAIEEKLEDATLQTQQLQLLGTPSYMSPEQAGCGCADVDTRSDIYGIGALLYELLTGVPPLRLPDSGQDPFEIRNLIANAEPKRPSALLSQIGSEDVPVMSKLEGSDPKRLAARVRGDLDWIVMKALEKDPTRRYDTAFGLGRDLHRFLHDEPVAARPPHRLYVVSKLIRRNRVAFSTAGVVLLALVAGFGVSTILYLRASRAEQRQLELRRTAENLLEREAKLRLQAEIRGKLTEAVVLTRKGDFETAAQLLARLEVPPDKPSYDAVTALRDVGLWLGRQQRWKEATKCFAWLFEIDILDPWQTVTLDFQAYGALLADSGLHDEYRNFCRRLAFAHQEGADGDEGGRILKTCLIEPIDSDLKEVLTPLAVTVEQWHRDLPSAQQSGWASLPLCLWRYRAGDFEQAAALARTNMAASDRNVAFHPTYEAILAMVEHQSGDGLAASALLKSAQSSVEAKFATLPVEGADGPGHWYDWVFARALLREAAELITPSK